MPGAVLLTVVAFVPLVIAPGLLFYFDVTPKVALLLAGAGVGLPLVGGAWKRVPVFGALIALNALSLSVSTLTSPNVALSLTGTNWRRLGAIPQAGLLAFALVMACSLAAHPELVRSLLRVVSLTGIAVALYAIAQYFGWDPWLPAQAYHAGEGFWTIVRPPSTLGYANYAATFLLHTGFLGAGLALSDDRRAWRGVGAAAALISAVAIVLSGTRAAIIGLLAGVVWMAASQRVLPVRHVVLAACATAAASVAFYLSPAGHGLQTRMHWSVEDPLGGPRLLLWRDSLRMAAARWLTGYGPETFGQEFPRFQSVELSRAYPDFYYESPHNMFLDAGVSQGLPGLAALAGFCVLGFYAGRRGGAVTASLVAAVVSQQFTCFIAPTALYFYLTVALLAAPSGSPLSANHRTTTVREWLPLLPISFLFAAFAVRLVRGDYALARARDRLDAGDLAGAAREYQRSGGADLWYSRKLASVAQQSSDPAVRFQASQVALLAAAAAVHSAEDRHNAWYNLAGFYAAAGDAAHTEQSLRETIRCSPNWFKPHWTLAQLLLRAGRVEEAVSEAMRASQLNGGKDPEVERTLAEIEAVSRSKQK